MSYSSQRVARVSSAAALVAGLAFLQVVPGRAGGVALDTPTVKVGRDLFNTYCASCHGTTGVGNGPVAESMRRSVPDITGLALANGGVFPIDRMTRIVAGRDVTSHGDRDMPVWGDAFKALPGGHAEGAVRERIRAILDYLQSIQRRRA